jgi:hypothetical protein
MRRIALPLAENGLPLPQSDRRLYKIEKFLCRNIDGGEVQQAPATQYSAAEPPNIEGPRTVLPAQSFLEIKPKKRSRSRLFGSARFSLDLIFDREPGVLLEY